MVRTIAGAYCFPSLFLLYTIHKNMSLGPSKTKSDSKIGQRKAIEKRNMKREICFPI